MKLLIEISKKAYDLLQGKGVDWLGAEHILDAVSNGTPISESEDCVNRKAVDKIINKWLSHPDYELKDGIYDMTKKIHKLPPVIPAEKVGHWINPTTMQCMKEQVFYYCSVCGNYADANKYCPNCGAKMQEVKNDNI